MGARPPLMSSGSVALNPTMPWPSISNLHTQVLIHFVCPVICMEYTLPICMLFECTSQSSALGFGRLRLALRFHFCSVASIRYVPHYDLDCHLLDCLAPFVHGCSSLVCIVIATRRLAPLTADLLRIQR
eukprot:5007801-Amphidinium_carterae.2